MGWYLKIKSRYVSDMRIQFLKYCKENHWTIQYNKSKNKDEKGFSEICFGYKIAHEKITLYYYFNRIYYTTGAQLPVGILMYWIPDKQVGQQNFISNKTILVYINV